MDFLRRGTFAALLLFAPVLAGPGVALAANVQANVDGGGPEAQSQSESTIIEFDYDDPADTPDQGVQDVILVGYNDFNGPRNCGGGFCFPWVGISRAVGGAGFQHTALPNGGRAGRPAGLLAAGDPVLAVDYHAALDGLGNPQVHLAHMMIPTPLIGGRVIQMYLSTSIDGGRTFPAGSALQLSAPTGGASDDKPWIAVDQRGGARPPDGNTYVCWSRLVTGTSSQILLSQIPPGGPPGAPIAITPVRRRPQFVQSCQVAVDIDGHVYVAWTEFLAVPTNTPQLMIRHASPPAGAAAVVFDPPVAVETLRAGNFGVPAGIVNCAAPNWLPQGSRGPFLYNFTMNASSLATNPFTGDIYLAWSMWNGPTGLNGASRFDVFLKSGARPGGILDWNRKRRVNQDGPTATDQFMPAVATHPLPVDPVPPVVSSTVSVGWSDKRNSGAPNNAFEIFGATSPLTSDNLVSDGGPELMNPTTRNLNCRIGDYNGLTSADIEVGTPDGNGPGSYFLHAWGDTRNDTPNASEVFFASQTFTPVSLIEIPPIFADLGLVLFVPQISSIEFPVGSSVPIPVDIFFVNNGPADATVNTWFAAAAPPGIRADWGAGAGQQDACFGPSPPDLRGPYVPEIGVPCSEGPIEALGNEQFVAVGVQVGLIRAVEFTCEQEGTYTIDLIGGVGPVLPIEVQDPDPSNNGLLSSITVQCLEDPRPPMPDKILWTTDKKIQWDPVAAATSYRVYRGEDLSAPQLRTPATDSCLRATTVATDTGEILTEVPPNGSYLWYLVNSVDGFAQESADPTRILDSAGDCAICAHDKCSLGPPALDSTCDACVATICAADPFCCGTNWDNLCIEEVRTLCGSLLCLESAGSCGHTLCQPGAGLTLSCDAPPLAPSCVDDICAGDPFCCSIGWDEICVDQVTTVCGKQCL